MFDSLVSAISSSISTVDDVHFILTQSLHCSASLMVNALVSH